MTRRTRRVLVAAGSLLGALTVLTIVVHLHVVQVAMGWTHPDGTGACPFGYDKPRARTAAAPRSGQPVLGFTLGTTTRADVDRWARDHQVRCVARRSTLECRDVDSLLLSQGGLARGTLWLDLDEGGIVVAVKTAFRSRESAPIASAFAASERSLVARAGEPSDQAGTLDELSIGMFRQAMRTFSAGGYRAVIRATNMGDGYLLTENHSL